MHRSGTTPLCRALENLGLFVGRHKTAENEAIFFQQLNTWTFGQCGASWENPNPVRELWDSEETRASVEECIRFVISSPRTISYLGVRKYLSNRTLFNITEHWGWKDPRNTFTLPLWLALFPNTKIVHITRNGVDVAQSLKVRIELVRKRRHVRFGKPSVRAMLHRRSWRDVGSFSILRCSTLDGGLSLWEEYCQEASRHIGMHKDHAIQIRFEDLLKNPVEHLRSLNSFCELDASPALVKQVAKDLKPDRAYAYRGDKELRSFADRVSSRLSKHGY